MIFSRDFFIYLANILKPKTEIWVLKIWKMFFFHRAHLPVSLACTVHRDIVVTQHPYHANNSHP
jgi:hypothetical protein